MTRRHREVAIGRELRALREGLRALWRSHEKSDARVADVERRLAALERLAATPDARRVPLAQAARMLGASRQHVYRLGLATVLDLLDVREPEAERATWSVGLDSLERLLAARRRERPGLLGQADPSIAGQRRISGAQEDT